MQIIVLRANRPYQKGLPTNKLDRQRLIRPYFYSFLIAIFVCEMFYIVLYSTNWYFGVPFLDLHALDPWTIVLQVALILLTFGILLVSFICIEAILIARLLRKKNKQSQRRKQRELGLLHPDIQSVRKPLRVIYYIHLILVILTFCAYLVVRQEFFAPSIMVAVLILFTMLRFWHTLHEKWPGKHKVGTSIADLSKYP